jgi:hypothetical protein
MLLFAVCGSCDAGGIFKVERPLLHRCGTLSRLSNYGETRSDASVFFQDAVKSPSRFREPQLPFFEGLISVQIIEKRSGAWRASQIFWGIIPDLQYSVHPLLVEPRRGMMRCP